MLSLLKLHSSGRGRHKAILVDGDSYLLVVGSLCGVESRSRRDGG